ncbi:DUF2017 family protein [Schaalia sp. lx-100]|uniref:DUF2017 family protein n=1 Tax=Schaalia sp. lx-100 TaxID=2899081 RepID=UPI001E636009|nr:DUF2017 family protein [Schaalia sp. lx-100]MCD4558099.1 DUF2017 domain-containing protein [Schaalia sp. lx-100]
MIETFVALSGMYQARIDGAHNVLLQQLAQEVLVILDAPEESSAFLAAVSVEDECHAPLDPALGYLLPEMSHDRHTAQNLRAMTEEYLRAEKSLRLRKIRSELEYARTSCDGYVRMSYEEAWDWARALNDLRLALAGELAINDESDVESLMQLICQSTYGKNARENAARIYCIVTWWQDSLVRVMQSPV